MFKIKTSPEFQSIMPKLADSNSIERANRIELIQKIKDERVLQFCFREAFS